MPFNAGIKVYTLYGTYEEAAGVTSELQCAWKRQDTKFYQPKNTLQMLHLMAERAGRCRS